MTSPEKISATIREFIEREPQDGQEAGLQMLVGQFATGFMAKLGSDPEEVDRQLEGIAAFVLGHRSDDAAPPVELIEGLFGDDVAGNGTPLDPPAAAA